MTKEVKEKIEEFAKMTTDRLGISIYNTILNAFAAGYEQGIKDAKKGAEIVITQ